MAITFRDIPNDVRVGTFTEFDSSLANQGLPLQPWKALVVGQKTAAGTSADNAIHRVSRIEDVIELAGVGSMLHRMMVRWFAANRNTPVDIICIPNGSMVSAIQTITVTVSSSTLATAGTLYLYVDGYRTPVALTTGMDADAVAAAIEAQLDLHAEYPFTASVTDEVVTVTAKNGGAHTAAMNIALDQRPGERSHAQVSIAVATSTPGSGEPTYILGASAHFDLIGDEPYNLFVMPYGSTSAGAAIHAEGDRRWAPDVKADGQFVIAYRDSYADHITATGNFNSQYILPVRYEEGAQTPPCEVAALVAGRVAKSAQNDPGITVKGTTLPGSLGAAVGAKFIQSERKALHNAGAGTLKCSPDGSMVIELLVSSRTLTDLGASDEAYLSANRMFILSYQRYSLENLFETRYPQCKLGDDGGAYGVGQKVMTPLLARGEILALFRRWEEIALVEDYDQFEADLIVERNATNRDRLDVLLPTNHINNFLVLASSIQFRI